MATINTNKAAMFIKVVETIEKRLEPVSSVMSSTWSVIEMETLEDGFDVTISITRVEDLGFLAEFPEEYDYLFQRVKDGSDKKVLKDIIDSNRVINALANLSGAVGLLKLHIRVTPEVRNQYVIESVESIMNDINRLQYVTHSYGPVETGRISTDFGVGDIIPRLTEACKENVVAAYKEIFSPARFTGQKFTCVGDVTIDPKVQAVAREYVVTFDKCLDMLDVVVENCERYIDIVPTKDPTDDGDSVSLNAVDDMLKDMSVSLEKVGNFTLNSAEDVVRRISHRMLQSALRRSQVNEAVEIKDIIGKLRMRMSSYKQDVESNGLRGGRESNGYERHVLALQFVVGYIQNDIMPAIQILQKALTVLVADDE